MSSDLIALKNFLECREDFNDAEIAFIHKTQHYAQKVSWIPGLRMIALCNSIAMKNADEHSDIDLFVVTENGRLWVVRFFVTLAFQLMGVRRYGKKTTGRFCLSFYATTEGMDLSAIALKETLKSKSKNLNKEQAISSSDLDLRSQNLEFPPVDPYLAYWCQTLLPIYDRGNTYRNFIDKNIAWIPDLIHSWEQISFLITCNERSSEGLFAKKSLDLFERLIRSIWLPFTLRMWRRLGKPWGVVISDQMLKFHPRDKRKEIIEGLSTRRSGS